jgi:hypothetical protein
MNESPRVRITDVRPRGPAIETEALGHGVFRRTFDYIYGDGTRVRFCRGQYLYHRKTGGKYVLTGFPARESDMNAGFSYASLLTGQEYWRPIKELVDGRFMGWDGSSELPPPDPNYDPDLLHVGCDHKRQKWNVFMSAGHCEDCGKPLGDEVVAAKQRELAASWNAQRAIMDGRQIVEEQPQSGTLTDPSAAQAALRAVFYDRPDYFAGKKHVDDQSWMGD